MLTRLLDRCPSLKQVPHGDLVCTAEMYTPDIYPIIGEPDQVPTAHPLPTNCPFPCSSEDITSRTASMGRVCHWPAGWVTCSLSGFWRAILTLTYRATTSLASCHCIRTRSTSSSELPKLRVRTTFVTYFMHSNLFRQHFQRPSLLASVAYCQKLTNVSYLPPAARCWSSVWRDHGIRTAAVVRC